MPDVQGINPDPFQCYFKRTLPLFQSTKDLTNGGEFLEA